MSNDNLGIIESLYVNGYRTLRDFDLPLDKVESDPLIIDGEMGGGKSSIIESCLMLKRASEPLFVANLNHYHALPCDALSKGCFQVALGANIKIGDERLYYCVWIGFWMNRGTIEREILERKSDGEYLLDRRKDKVDIFLDDKKKWKQKNIYFSEYDSSETALSNDRFQEICPEIGKAAACLSSIEVVLTPTRYNKILFAERYFRLKHAFGEEHWDETLDLLRLVLGSDLEDVAIDFDPDTGSMRQMIVRAKGGRNEDGAPIETEKLPIESAGWLRFMLLLGVIRSRQQLSLLAIDDGEASLSESTALRLLELLRDAGERYPVIMVTKDENIWKKGFEEETDSWPTICELDESGNTRLNIKSYRR